jgi:hypothetical protein
VDLRDLAEAGAVQCDAMESQSVMQIRSIGQPSAKSVDGLTDYHFEFAILGILDQLEETGPLAGGAADSCVAVRTYESPSSRLNIPAADFNLVLDRRFPLLVAGVSRVDHSFHQEPFHLTVI